MNLNNIMFIDNLPKLDLHGLDKQTSIVLINDFIHDNVICQNSIVVIIHGFGEYILKNATHDILNKHKNVDEYKLFIYNAGCTLVKLNFKK